VPNAARRGGVAADFGMTRRATRSPPDGKILGVNPLRVLSATAVVAALFACSSSSTTAPAQASGDAGDAGDADDADDAGRAKGCPGEAPVTYAWQPPAAPQDSACDEADLAKLARAIAQASVVSAGDIADALGPSCAACALGRVSDTTWRAVVVGHEGYIGNVGGCAVHLGANETCGKAVDTLSTCLILGCDGCTDRKAQDACSDQLTTVDGACAPALTTMRKQCPAAALVSAFDSNGVCQSFVETIRLFCGPRAQDAG
jgi:hypothetical protein